MVSESMEVDRLLNSSTDEQIIPDDDKHDEKDKMRYGIDLYSIF